MEIRKFGMNYGAVLGLILVLFALTFWVFGIKENESVIPAILNNIVVVGFLVYGISQYRDHYNNSFISYSQSLKLGTTIAFFSSVIVAFYSFIHISYLEPNMLSDVLHETEQAMLQANPEISDEQLDLTLSMTAKFMQPHWLMIMSVLGGTLMGFIYSLIISIFLKNNNPTDIFNENS